MLSLWCMGGGNLFWKVSGICPRLSVLGGVVRSVEEKSRTKNRTAPTAEQEWTVNDMRLKVIDYDAVRVAFDEKFKETWRLSSRWRNVPYNLAEGFHEADRVIWRMPTIDAVTVVRCKDCKCYDEPDGDGWRYEHDRSMTTDGFCSYGERKDGDG